MQCRLARPHGMLSDFIPDEARRIKRHRQISTHIDVLAALPREQQREFAFALTVAVVNSRGQAKGGIALCKTLRGLL